LDLGIDLRSEEVEDGVGEWNDVDFGVPEEEKEREKESDVDEPDSPIAKSPTSEPFSPDAVTDDEALPQMAPPMFIRQKSYVMLGKKLHKDKKKF